MPITEVAIQELPVAIAALSSVPTSRRSVRALKPSHQPLSFRQKWERAKAEAGEGLVFFDVAGHLTVFYEDAEIASEVLGILANKRPGDHEAPLTLTLCSHFERNFRYLRAAGHDDIWIASGILNKKPKPADNVGQINSFRQAAIYSDRDTGND